jgi:glycosyltransferase involved in cell wall biosynthesis
VGGAERLTGVLRDGLRARGHEVELLATRAGAGRGAPPAERVTFGSDRPRLKTLARTLNPPAALAVRRAVRELRPNVVHVRMYLQQLSPAILPALRGVPALYHAVLPEAICPIAQKLLPDGSVCPWPAGRVCHDAGCLSWPAAGALLAQEALARRWHPFRLVVANSRALALRLEGEGVPGPVEVVPNGVPVRAARPPLGDAPVVAFAGRLAREKGADVLLRAFRRVADALPAARLVVAGDGAQRPALERLAAALGLGDRVALLGHLPPDALERALEGAWVQAVPSRWDEPFGLVAAEAMMRGTAVVASGSGGLAEVVEDGRSGLLVPPGDEEALAGALLRVLRDRGEAERLGAAGRARALERFAEPAFVGRFAQLYERLATVAA